MSFLGEDYLLGNAAALRLFRQVKGLKVIDLHNHANVGEIAENTPYHDMWQLFAASDHYVWEVMRKCGVPEDLITGKASPRDKFSALGRVFPKIAGNPVYEWICLDLKRCFGFEEVLNEGTAEKIWSEGNKKLASDEFRPRRLLTEKLNVEVICSTDDPADDLAAHRRINAELGRVMVRPTWRPDRLMRIAKPDWNDAVDALGERFGIRIDSLKKFMEALRLSHDFFAENHCVASDHGLETPLGHPVGSSEAEAVFDLARARRTLAPAQISDFMSFFLREAAKLNAEKNFVMQLHMGAVRDVRKKLYDALGPDSGGDVSNHFQDFLPELAAFLNSFDGKLKTVLYCLDPSHQATLATLARAFGENVRLGSAWWLCDTPVGMKRQLEYIASVDLLSAFAGMVSDSRKLLSYGSRFEMFRRVLCDVTGEMVERGRMPEDVAAELVTDICYAGPKRFFGV